MQRVTRYHPLLVALHWVLALMVTASLLLGALVLVRIPNSDPMKPEALRQHMLGGVLLLVLMLARLLVRTRTAHPARPTTGHATLDRLAWLSHRLIYALVLGQATAGLALAFQSGLPDIVFGHRGALPPSFWVYPARWVHFAISRLLLALIALHVTAALYHAFVLRDGLLRRMWFGARAPSEAASAAATRSSSAS